MKNKRKYAVKEGAFEFGLSEGFVVELIRREWIIPEDREHRLLDDEDLSRARLILELRDAMGVNDEAIPIILHLIDQIHGLHRWIHQRDAKDRA